MPKNKKKKGRKASANQQKNQTAAQSSQGQVNPQSAVSRTEGKQPETEKRTVRAGRGQALTVTTTQTLAGRESQPAAQSAKGTTNTRDKMNRSDGDHLKTTGEEPMETDVEEDHNKMTKTTNTSAGMTWSTGCAESSSMKSGCTPSGGEGHRDDSSYTQDSDSGGTDDTGMEEEKQMKKPSLYDARRAWKGVSLDYLKTTPACLPEDLKLERGSEHYVAIKTPFEYKKDQIPEPFNTSGRWDTDYVRMPYDYHSKCFRNGKDKDRWEVIVEALHAPIRGPFELEEAILKYNQRYINKWKFTVLHHYFIKQMSLEERNTFFETVLPMMIELTLKIKDICPKIPLLKKGGKVKKLTLSQQQIACLLANAFFCTFPLRNSKMRTSSDYSDYPDINFCHLFVGDPVPRKLQKIQCIIHYFKRVLQESLTGIVTFSRQTLSSGHNWQGSMENLSQLHVSSTGTIEDNGRGMLQVDFANKYIGGGVLGHGCVQEEIRFVICPEMIVTRLFTQALDSMDCLIMTGCERYSEYKGYSDSFCWKGDFVDKTQRDKLGRLCCEVVAIDAQVFRADYYKQFKRTCVDRELNKAYCGFKTSAKEVNRSAVCTGNWGCGAFGGDKQLKALIQVMAASVAKRDVCYFTFDDEPLTRDLSEIHKRLCRERKSVGDVYSLLWDYNRALTTGYPSPGTSLFDFIHCQLDQENTAFRRQNQRDFWKSETNNSMEDSFVLSAKDLKESASWPAPGSGNFWSKATDSNRKDDFRHSHMEQKEAGSRPAPRSGSFWSQDTDSNRKDDLRQSHMEQKEAGPRPAPGSGSVSNQEADSNRKDDIRHSHMEQKEAGPRPAPGSPTLDDSDVD